MDSLELANRITDIIIERQGEDTLILDLREVTTFTDYFVITTANSRRQLDALQNAIKEELKQGDVRTLARSFEGNADAGWILIEYSDVIVHLFTEGMRSYYQLEDLWKNAQVVARIR